MPGKRGALDTNDDVLTVIDNVLDRDGTDRLTHIERLQFADQTLVLAPGLNNEPVGLLAISDTTPTEGQTLTVSIAGVSDADNPGGTITGPVSYVWQVERDPVNAPGIFEDIAIPGQTGVAIAKGRCPRELTMSFELESNADPSTQTSGRAKTAGYTAARRTSGASAETTSTATRRGHDGEVSEVAVRATTRAVQAIAGPSATHIAGRVPMVSSTPADWIPAGAHYNDALFRADVAGRVGARATTWSSPGAYGRN